MFHKRIVFVTLTLALSLGAGRAAADGDGDVWDDRKPTPPERAVECIPSTTFCPAYPTTLRIGREEFLAQLRDLSGCADGEEDVKERRLRDVGDAASVTTALAHFVFADPNLLLHDVKNAVTLIGDSQAGNGPLALREILGQSDAIVARTIEGGPIAAFDRPAREEYIRRHAEELRRIVVLAIARYGSSEATALLRQATNDAGRSVAIAAARALESRRR